MYLLWFRYNSRSKLKSPNSDMDPVFLVGQLKLCEVIQADVLLCCPFCSLLLSLAAFTFLANDHVDSVGDKVGTLKV